MSVRFPFSEADLRRYSRQMILPEVGGGGQARLGRARVVVVGAGGLGSPAALYLAAAGIGTLGLVDADRVDLSNLQRQILHGTKALDVPKVVSAQGRLEELNPDVRVVPHALRLDAGQRPGGPRRLRRRGGGLGQPRDQARRQRRLRGARSAARRGGHPSLGRAAPGRAARRERLLPVRLPPGGSGGDRADLRGGRHHGPGRRASWGASRPSRRSSSAWGSAPTRRAGCSSTTAWPAELRAITVRPDPACPACGILHPKERADG